MLLLIRIKYSAKRLKIFSVTGGMKQIAILDFVREKRAGLEYYEIFYPFNWVLLLFSKVILTIRSIYQSKHTVMS